MCLKIGVKPNMLSKTSSTFVQIFADLKMKPWLIATLWWLRLQYLRRRKRLLLLKRKYQLRTRHYLTRECLQPVNDCAWSHLYLYGSDLSFLHVTSLTRDAFNKLHTQFKVYYKRPKFASGGRPEKVTSTQALGCILQFYTDRMDLKSLSLLHGLPPATLSRTLDRAEVALLNASNQCYKRVMYVQDPGVACRLFRVQLVNSQLLTQ